MGNFVITIARGFGSGGKDIGMRLSKALGIPCYDRQLISMASDRSMIDESLFVEVDEKLRGQSIQKFLNRMPSQAVLEPHEKGFTSDINLFNIVAEVIRTLAKTESCIIIGKCADDILKDYDNVLSLYIEAPRVACVKSIMEKMNVSEKRAHQLIRSTDSYRAKYYSFYSGGKDWTNPTNYDLVLNSDRMGRENCVRLIEDLVKIRFS
ncbi:MAG: cytidylate kinase-like family protein [Candidatus Weimeria sp.]|nr:cytidylate kinase-like family protein [Candidatus Weimeria sp.]